MQTAPGSQKLVQIVMKRHKYVTLYVRIINASLYLPTARLSKVGDDDAARRHSISPDPSLTPRARVYIWEGSGNQSNGSPDTSANELRTVQLSLARP